MELILSQWKHTMVKLQDQVNGIQIIFLWDIIIYSNLCHIWIKTKVWCCSFVKRGVYDGCAFASCESRFYCKISWMPLSFLFFCFSLYTDYALYLHVYIRIICILTIFILHNSLHSDRQFCFYFSVTIHTSFYVCIKSRLPK